MKEQPGNSRSLLAPAVTATQPTQQRPRHLPDVAHPAAAAHSAAVRVPADGAACMQGNQHACGGNPTQPDGVCGLCAHGCSSSNSSSSCWLGLRASAMTSSHSCAGLSKHSLQHAGHTGSVPFSCAVCCRCCTPSWCQCCHAWGDALCVMGSRHLCRAGSRPCSKGLDLLWKIAQQPEAYGPAADPAAVPVAPLLAPWADPDTLPKGKDSFRTQVQEELTAILEGLQGLVGVDTASAAAGAGALAAIADAAKHFGLAEGGVTKGQ